MLKRRYILLTLLLWGYFFYPVYISAEPSPRPFSRYEFSVNFDPTHNVISGDFVSRAGNELLILGEKDNGDQVMAIYGFDAKADTFMPIDEYIIPDNIVAFDTLRDVNARDKIVLLSATRLSLINFDTDSIKDSRASLILDGESSIFVNPKPQFIAEKNLVRDFNGDGLDDIAISDFSYKKILLQQSLNGERQFVFQKLPINSIVDMGKEQIAFVERPMFSVDANFDELKDIVIAGDGELQVYQQLANRTFTDQVEIIKLPMAVSDLPWWYLRDSDGDTADQSTLSHQKLESIMDINGDGIFDLMLMNTKSSGLLNRQNRYGIYFGKQESGKIVFGESPDTEIGSNGTLTGLRLLDVDMDDKQEVYVESFDIGLTQIIGALISGKIKQDIFFFSLNEEGKYDSEPNFNERVNLNFSLAQGRAGEPIVVTTDLDGDGLKELIVSSKNSRLAIHEGIDKLKHFYARTETVKIKLPDKGSMLVARNIFSQEKKDLVIRYGRQDDPVLRRKIVVLSF